MISEPLKIGSLLFEGLDQYGVFYIRAITYAGIATVATILIGYPVAYVIAFRGGRWRNVLLGPSMTRSFLALRRNR